MLNLDIVHKSEHFDETKSFLSKKNLRLSLQSGHSIKSFNAKITAQYFKSFYLSEIEYGTGVTLLTPADAGEYVISFPLYGETVSVGRRVEMRSNGRFAFLNSPSMQNTSSLSGDAKRISIVLNRAAVRAYFSQLAGEPVIGEIEFDPVIDLHSPVGRSVLASLELFATARQPMLGRIQSPLQIAAFEEQIISALLLHHPHTHIERLAAVGGSPACRDVKRTIEFIRANIREPIRLEQLVEVANVPGRTLNEHFRRFTGLSPSAYVKAERLKEARRRLATGAETSVSEVARSCGFTHLGRFSIEYTNAFGEAPSATLKNRKLS